MGLNQLEPIEQKIKTSNDNLEFAEKLQLAEFALWERIVTRLLNLLSLTLVFFLAVIGFNVWQGKDIAQWSLGALITGTVGCLGNLLYLAIKHHRRARK
jgi:hypothetical protein